MRVVSIFKYNSVQKLKKLNKPVSQMLSCSFKLQHFDLLFEVHQFEGFVRVIFWHECKAYDGLQHWVQSRFSAIRLMPI